jgi:hypothetical protein
MQFWLAEEIRKAGPVVTMPAKEDLTSLWASG